ncbi:MAG: hypothetical protein RLZZ229_444 [Actinomycetota bacterium]|jgi:uncharacterized LabA/DUF88 family protein
MRVGVYVDAFNLYYGAREHCGRGEAGWRWLDIESLCEAFIDKKAWSKAQIVRIVYCTALRVKDDDPSSIADQKAYISALAENKKVTVEYGNYQPRHGKGLLVTPRRKGKYKRAVRPPDANGPSWIPFRDFRGPEGQSNLAIFYETYEEKGSDVNLGFHLTKDILQKQIDAAIVISNDGDLRLPIEFARSKVHVGLINPNSKDTSNYLRGEASAGAGLHWWRRLNSETLQAHQLPSKVAGIPKPMGW